MAWWSLLSSFYANVGSAAHQEAKAISLDFSQQKAKYDWLVHCVPTMVNSGVV